jgi:IS66 C-terminal element/Transposase IS66 family
LPARVCTGEENAPYQGTHNSAAERALRAVALGRKNCLFAGSDSGGERAAALYSLIGSATLNGLDPELYLRTVLAQIADYPVSQIHDLLPLEPGALASSPLRPSRLDTFNRCPPKNKRIPHDILYLSSRGTRRFGCRL